MRLFNPRIGLSLLALLVFVTIFWYFSRLGETGEQINQHGSQTESLTNSMTFYCLPSECYKKAASSSTEPGVHVNQSNSLPDGDYIENNSKNSTEESLGVIFIKGGREVSNDAIANFLSGDTSSEYTIHVDDRKFNLKLISKEKTGNQGEYFKFSTLPFSGVVNFTIYSSESYFYGRFYSPVGSFILFKDDVGYRFLSKSDYDSKFGIPTYVD